MTTDLLAADVLRKPEESSTAKQIPESHQSRIKNFMKHQYLIAYITSANLGILMHWFETGRQLPPSEVALIITRIINDGPLVSTGLKSL